MLAAIRRERIVDLVSAHHSISSDELAEQLEVSVETVRRDLTALHEIGQLTRVRGGAIHSEVRASSEPSFRDRTKIAIGEKNAIAEIAAQLAEGLSTIFIDIGTTSTAVARALVDSFAGTVITPSMRVAEVLGASENIDIFIPGGKIRAGDMSVSGSTACEFLESVNPDIAFLGTGGIDLDAGFTDFELQEIDIKRTVLRNSRRSFALADSSKFSVRAPFKVCDLADLAGIITDPELPSVEQERYISNGVEVLNSDTASA